MFDIMQRQPISFIKERASISSEQWKNQSRWLNVSPGGPLTEMVSPLCGGKAPVEHFTRAAPRNFFHPVASR